MVNDFAKEKITEEQLSLFQGAEIRVILYSTFFSPLSCLLGWKKNKNSTKKLKREKGNSEASFLILFFSPATHLIFPLRSIVTPTDEFATDEAQNTGTKGDQTLPSEVNSPAYRRWNGGSSKWEWIAVHRWRNEGSSVCRKCDAGVNAIVAGLLLLECMGYDCERKHCKGWLEKQEEGNWREYKTRGSTEWMCDQPPPGMHGIWL